MRGLAELAAKAGSRDDENAVLGLDLSQAEQFYQQMVLIRYAEERLLDLFSTGALNGTTHTSIGQEANAVGVINALDRSLDTVWSHHRCHGHFIAYSGQVASLFAEVMGRTLGVCRGRGGSQHLCYRNFYSNGIQGGIAPLAVGSALGDRAKGAVTVVFIGDGTTGEGALYESLNMAAVWNVPVLFVLEDNGIAQTTPKELTLAGALDRRAEPFGIRSFAYDGADVMDIHALASDAVRYVRHESRPAWLYIRTERIGPHSKGDDTRSPERIAAARARDPLPILRSRVANAADIESRCMAIVDSAVSLAQQAPIARG
ncbi:thiamine pyrophosphate-dependent dehydrogenase E1 component subunit alpha [Azospirillum isscasi]|uniref:Thiamine pyrophosphate-dependent dehydrogenase E1 component subunit alpha n=1 Tax=Azospirillum isscasi TaxID=3053926 RepID=A0ABU0WGK4_9PROT|nr:thiamine pyrophosphate-dependent dehydrogenase E1 component subunit alpha [Azospirillum isscasi]MDQ2103338.1 thiamine pyrophosphate-dependent dehydrogenase E1 component subunit alpha [Azospirillum isscasi]